MAIEVSYKKRASLIRKLIGNRIVDALLFMPSYGVSKKYVFPVTRSNINQTIVTKFKPLAIIKGRNRHKPVKVLGTCGDSQIELVFFHARAAYFKYYLKVGVEVSVCGKLTESATGTLQFIHPERISKSEMARSLSGIQNIYPLTAGVSIFVVQSVISHSIELMRESNIAEWIPDSILLKHNWKSFKESIYRIHNPLGHEDTTLNGLYRQRLCFDECLAEQVSKKISRDKRSDKGFVIQNERKLFKRLLEKLPFQLTADQIGALTEIESDLSSGKNMARLLQGDVGTGKTIVSLLASLLVIESGYQVALLAPTEILARQHYEGFKNILSELGDETCINILTSNETGKKRKVTLQSLMDGSTNIIVGTHAIISESVVFSNLGMVIVDEQHRFGVNQRLKLINKGKSVPHVLSMTATPIPRTLILSVYGDIDVSLIKSKPIGRKDITTRAVPMSNMLNVIESIKEVIARDEKVYWICPLIEESEKLDYTCVINRFEFLREHFADEVTMMHGKMKTEERREIFEDFRGGKTHVLVSTTIIEVGVDVPDATVIIIENAEKFGLSQLHQLRGRVGRSDLQSFCILLYEDNIGKIQRERLKTIRESNDGFYIAEKDLLIRGSGEILGTKQSGMKKYRTFNVDDQENKITIFEIMREANEVAQNIDISKCEALLKMFMIENFENVKQSF
jgi:ATP-dependent DNA helicase RecG